MQFLAGQQVSTRPIGRSSAFQLAFAQALADMLRRRRSRRADKRRRSRSVLTCLQGGITSLQNYDSSSSSRSREGLYPDFPRPRMEPALPMLRIEPVLPMLRMLPELPMLRMDPTLPMLRMEPALRMLPTLRKLMILCGLRTLSRLAPALRACCRAAFRYAFLSNMSPPRMSPGGSLSSRFRSAPTERPPLRRALPRQRRPRPAARDPRRARR
jgi:hypothetical protein